MLRVVNPNKLLNKSTIYSTRLCDSHLRHLTGQSFVEIVVAWYQIGAKPSSQPKIISMA